MRCDLDQIQVQLPRHSQGFGQGSYPELLALGVDQAHVHAHGCDR